MTVFGVVDGGLISLWPPESPMDATELARWTRFAAKGGIGKCTALCDCVAENDGDLMFLKVASQTPSLPQLFTPYM